MLGKILAGRYEIVSHLGGGGFGQTFVARDTKLPGTPQCAVKLLRPQAHDPVTLQTARRMFDTEAQVLYRLGNHERIPQLLAYFEENEEFYLVQEFIEGHDLSLELTPGKRLSQEEVITFLEEIFEILEFVHEQKVIHRDINPRNILRQDKDKKLVLIDFGAVKQIATTAITSQGTSNFTVAIGTPGYIPGEQANGNPKFSSDIYAVGIIAIQALTGLSPEELPKDINTDEIVWQNQAEVTQDFAFILDKMVRYDFRDRYPSAKEVRIALKELKSPSSGTVALSPAPLQNQNQPIKRNKFSLKKVLLGIVLLAVGGVASVFIYNAVNSVNATGLYSQANTLHDLQKYSDALSTYEKAINIRPDYAEAWNGKGKTLYKLKRYEDALAAYDKAIQLKPDYLDAWMGRGFTQNNLQRYSSAINSFDKVIQLENKYPEVWTARGDALNNLKRYDEAIQSYDKAIELRKDSYEAWYSKGLLLHNLKRYDEAINSFDKALEIKPSYEQAWYHKGNALVNLQRYQDAFNAYDKAVQYKPDYAAAWLSRSNILVNLKRYPEAIESFNRAVKYNPNSYQAWSSRGWSLHQVQRYESAVNSYNKAIELKKNDYQVWYNRGNSLYNLQKYQDALNSYNRAVRLKQDHYESWFSRGNTFFNLKRYQDAISSYEQAIKYKPDYQQAIKARNQAQSALDEEKSSVIVPVVPQEGTGNGE